MLCTRRSCAEVRMKWGTPPHEPGSKMSATLGSAAMLVSCRRNQLWLAPPCQWMHPRRSLQYHSAVATGLLTQLRLWMAPRCEWVVRTHRLDHTDLQARCPAFPHCAFV